MVVGRQLLVLLHWGVVVPGRPSTYAPAISRHPFKHQASDASLK